MNKENNKQNIIENTVIEKLENILNKRERYGIDIDYINVSLNSNLLNDLELDSLEIMSFLIDMEKVFLISFDEPYELVENADTVGSLVNYINDKMMGDSIND